MVGSGALAAPQPPISIVNRNRSSRRAAPLGTSRPWVVIGGGRSRRSHALSVLEETETHVAVDRIAHPFDRIDVGQAGRLDVDLSQRRTRRIGVFDPWVAVGWIVESREDLVALVSAIATQTACSGSHAAILS